MHSFLGPHFRCLLTSKHFHSPQNASVRSFRLPQWKSNGTTRVRSQIRFVATGVGGLIALLAKLRQRNKVTFWLIGNAEEPKSSPVSE